MIPAGQSLSYDAAPAFSTPLRFFLTAPAFGIAAGATLLAVPELLDSRWTPGALAVTHLVAVGFMLSVMLGALLQILPVVAGAVIPLSGAVSTVVHLALTAGAICLAWGLGSGSRAYLVPATVLLGGALMLFLLAAAIGLRRAPLAPAPPRPRGGGGAVCGAPRARGGPGPRSRRRPRAICGWLCWGSGSP